jgi:hypothetical protein
MSKVLTTNSDPKDYCQNPHDYIKDYEILAYWGVPYIITWLVRFGHFEVAFDIVSKNTHPFSLTIVSAIPEWQNYCAKRLGDDIVRSGELFDCLKNCNYTRAHVLVRTYGIGIIDDRTDLLRRAMTINFIQMYKPDFSPDNVFSRDEFDKVIAEKTAIQIPCLPEDIENICKSYVWPTLLDFR